MAMALSLPLAFSITLATQGITLAQQGPQLRSIYMNDPLPAADPRSPAWDQAPVLDVPLTAQAGIPPTLGAASIPSVKVRSLNDGSTIIFRMEWQDNTQDMDTNRANAFRDAAALLFVVGDGLPAVCMGTPTQLTDIWHWKADWQQDIDKGFQEVIEAYPNFWRDYYPYAVGTPPFSVPADFDSDLAREYLVGWSVGNPLSQILRQTPVEELTAKGFGTATTKTAQTVLGRGEWRGGQWRVVFARALRSDNADSAAIGGKKEVPFAIAIWNGSNQEVGARKQVSSFVNVVVQGPAGATGGDEKAAEAETNANRETDSLIGWLGIAGLGIVWVGVIGFGLRRRGD
jgi:hypothetical protein